MRSLLEGKTYDQNATSLLRLCYILEKCLDLSIQAIQGLQVKGLQSYQLSKLEDSRKSLPLWPIQPKRVWTRFELDFELDLDQLILMASNFTTLFKRGPIMGLEREALCSFGVILLLMEAPKSWIKVDFNEGMERN